LDVILGEVRSLRLGDIIDDWCVKCRRLTNHAIVSLVEAEAAKVRCRSCYSDHNYLREVQPPSKKELKRLAEAELAGTVVDKAGKKTA
jgi:formate dehydrogenase maturation protein FdhE